MSNLSVLDKGFVRLVDHMGNDKRIVDAARVSFGNQDEDAEFSNKDRKLIRYLMRNRHTSPFEKVVFEFHVKAPKPIAVQWMRHRTGSFNEVSGRYTELPDEYYEPEEFRTNEGVSNKQGSRAMGPEVAHEDELRRAWENGMRDGNDAYRFLLWQGVAKEQSRFVMPYGFYTQFYWTVNLHNLLHFLSLRIDEHAQYEIQMYANAILHIIQPIVPVTIEAWDDYVLNAVTLDTEERDFLRFALRGLNRANLIPEDRMSLDAILTKLQ